jgi:murein DD-endopeptidase MepM/ murein hydrolase activator NlpD
LHVTIAHADGVRTSYSFLASIDVARGQTVEQGGVVGRAGDRFHFGARIGTVYVDPAVLFGAGPTVVALVPHDRPLSATVRFDRAAHHPQSPQWPQRRPGGWAGVASGARN